MVPDERWETRMPMSDIEGSANAIATFVLELDYAAPTMCDPKLRVLEGNFANRLRDVGYHLRTSRWELHDGVTEVLYHGLLHGANECLDAFAMAEMVRREGSYEPKRPWQTLVGKLDRGDAFAGPVRRADLLIREPRNLLAAHRHGDELTLLHGEGIDLWGSSFRPFPILEGGPNTEDGAIREFAIALGETPPPTKTAYDPFYYRRWLRRVEEEAIGARLARYQELKRVLLGAYRKGSLVGPTVGEATSIVIELAGLHLGAFSTST